MQGKKLINDGIKKKKEKDCEEFSIEDEIKSQKKRMKGKGETEKKMTIDCLGPVGQSSDLFISFSALCLTMGLVQL